MPILACHGGPYPFDARELSASIRLGRAGDRCGCCGRPHRREVLCFGEGLWWDEDALAWRYGAGLHHRSLPPPHTSALPMRRTRVFLSTCHLDHDPRNNAADNLAALCQRCHILHGVPEHRRRAVTVRARWACGDLFTGPYG